MSNAEQSVHPHTRTVRDGGYMKTIAVRLALSEVMK